MKIHLPYLTHLLQAGAIGQFLVAGLNLRLPQLLRWESEIARLPVLLREVFQVHVWFISITLTIFATVTLRFAGELHSNPIGRWLACGIGLFWAIRTVIQVVYYSSTHWRGKSRETAIHLVLLAAYGGLAVVYLAAGAGLSSE